MEDLELSPKVLNALRKARLFTLKSILHLSSSDLVRCTKLSLSEVLHLLKVASETFYSNQRCTGSPSHYVLNELIGWSERVAIWIDHLEYILHFSRPANFPHSQPEKMEKWSDKKETLDLKNHSCPDYLVKKRLSTGCPYLDEFLKGGILTQGITEITGESAAGKTQLCLQLCLAVQQPTQQMGLDGGAVYICTEDIFPSKRLQQMISSFESRFTPRNENLGENIFVEHIAEKDQLWHCIEQRIPVLLAKGQVKLVVVDSVAALFRSDFQACEAFKRAKDLQNFAARLHKLSFQYNIPVVCVNQVTANMNSSSSSEAPYIPALGQAWSSSIQTRLMLRRTPYKLTGSVGDENSHVKKLAGYEIPVRSIEIMFAPHLPPKIMYYVVDCDGVKGLR